MANSCFLWLSPATVAANGALSGFGKGEERDGDDGRGTRDDVSNSKAVAANSTEVPSENGGSTPFLQVSMFKRIVPFVHGLSLSLTHTHA